MLYEVDDRIATITLNRPERLNAWTRRMGGEYRHCLARAAGDDGVRVIVVTGAGRGFCAGADTEALQGHADKGGYGERSDDGAQPGYGVRSEFDAELATTSASPSRSSRLSTARRRVSGSPSPATAI